MFAVWAGGGKEAEEEEATNNSDAFKTIFNFTEYSNTCNIHRPCAVSVSASASTRVRCECECECEWRCECSHDNYACGVLKALETFEMKLKTN